MTSEQQKEQFSVALVRAVAAAARVNTYKPEVDSYKVDIGFVRETVEGRPQRPRLEAQLKCTSRYVIKKGAFSFRLDVATCDALRADDLIPQILIVCLIPQKPMDWLHQNAD